jgi:hypothetical protein
VSIKNLKTEEAALRRGRRTGSSTSPGPFFYGVWPVAFSTPEQKFYNRLSFVIADNQGALAKGFQ